MKDRIGQLMADVAAAEFSGADEVEAFRVAYLGRKGKMKDLMAAFKEVPGDQKRELGPMLNALKQAGGGGCPEALRLRGAWGRVLKP